MFVGCWHDEASDRSRALRSADSWPVPKLKINANPFTSAESKYCYLFEIIGLADTT
jgi:hypothetical protein